MPRAFITLSMVVIVPVVLDKARKNSAKPYSLMPHNIHGNNVTNAIDNGANNCRNTLTKLRRFIQILSATIAAT
ncbi:MAG UNVERIFIED_CONTAM: hypothetical protein LVR29_34590 [Microcystis novacekii LVE1205-3]